MLLYGCFLWSPLLKRRTAILRLRSVQRLTALTVTRAFKSTSTESALILADWIPLDVRARQLSVHTAIKLNSPSDTKREVGHLYCVAIDINSCEISLSSADYPKRSPLQDYPPWLNIPFSISSCAIERPPSLSPTTNAHFHIYTDASKSTYSTRCAAVITDHEGHLTILQRRLNDNCSIFEAETTAITDALDYIGKYLPEGSLVDIFSDSKQSLSSALSKKRTLSFTRLLQQRLLRTGQLF